jgi:hypothetical protein
MRWQFYLDKVIELDEYAGLPYLIDIGKQFIEENDESIYDIVNLFQ